MESSMYAILAILGLVGAWFAATSENSRHWPLKWGFATLPLAGFAEIFTDIKWLWAFVVAFAVISLVLMLASMREQETATFGEEYVGFVGALASASLLAWGVIFAVIGSTSVWMMVLGGLLLIAAAFALSGVRVALGATVVAVGLVAALIAGLIPIDTGGGLTQEDLDNAVAEAVAEREAELQADIDRLEENISQKDAQIEAHEQTIAELETENADLSAKVAELEATVAEMEAEIAELNSKLTELEAVVAERDETIAQLTSDLARAEAALATEGRAGSRPVENPAGVRRLKGGMTEYGAPQCVNLNPDMLRGSAAKAHLESIDPESEIAQECFDALDDFFATDAWILADELTFIGLHDGDRKAFGDKLASDPVAYEEALDKLETARVSQSLSCLDGRKLTQWFASDWKTILEGFVNRPCERDVVIVSNYDVDGDGDIDATTNRRTHCGFQRLVPKPPPPPSPEPEPTTTTSTTVPEPETTTTTQPTTTTTEPPTTTTTVPEEGKIIIVKKGTSKHDDKKVEFAFYSSIEGFAPELAIGKSDSVHVPAGTYTIGERTEDGWTLVNISCDDGDSTVNVEAGEASIVVSEGETVTCKFTNEQDKPFDGEFKAEGICVVKTWEQEVRVTDIDGDFDRFEIGGVEGTVRTFPGDEPAIVPVVGYPSDGSEPIVKEVYLPGDCIEPDFKPELVCDLHRQVYVLTLQSKQGVFESFDPPVDGSHTLPGDFSGSITVTGDPKYGKDVVRKTNRVDGDCVKDTTTTSSTSTTSTSTTSTTSTSTTSTTSTSTTTTTMPTTTTTVAPHFVDFKPELVPQGGSQGGYVLTLQSWDGDVQEADWTYIHPVSGAEVSWNPFASFGSLPTFDCSLSSNVSVRAYPGDGGTVVVRSTNRVDGNCPTPPSTTSTTHAPSTTTTTTLPSPDPGDF